MFKARQKLVGIYLFEKKVALAVLPQDLKSFNFQMFSVAPCPYFYQYLSNVGIKIKTVLSDAKLLCLRLFEISERFIIK